MASSFTSTSTTLTGKRKRQTEPHADLILHIAASDSDADAPPVAQARKRPFACNYAGCTKSYSKPSRLAEHKRTHTGERPYVCLTCQNSYLRESHLQAHARSHLPSSSRPLGCTYEGCGKRFWTPQHLRVHADTHTAEKLFKCAETDCYETFSKQNQLRSHVCTAHAPAGTKPYICVHPGCTKSFASNQKLTTHRKSHEANRYTCIHDDCLSADPVFYPNWTSLQEHVRTVHPPTCPYLSCAGRTFTQQKGLRAHMKLHEHRDVEATLAIGATQDSDGDESNATSRAPRKRRRGGDYGRDWKCEVDGCTKDFKSKKALNTHNNVFHLGRRDFVCTETGCEEAFGYKHLLQRHTAKIHAAHTSDSGADEGHSPNEDDAASLINAITGQKFAARSLNPRALRCPHPQPPFEGSYTRNADADACEYWFTRAYDLRRHLLAAHGLDVDKEVVDEWVDDSRAAR